LVEVVSWNKYAVTFCNLIFLDHLSFKIWVLLEFRQEQVDGRNILLLLVC
jgi:hypothetical protein